MIIHHLKKLKKLKKEKEHNLLYDFILKILLYNLLNYII